MFYLTPVTAGGRVDSFLEVKWVDSSDIKDVELNSRGRALESKVSIINETIKISKDLEFSILNEKSFPSSKNRIFEVELKNTGRASVALVNFEILAFNQKTLLPHQTVAWEKDAVSASDVVRGRLIVLNDTKGGPVQLTVKFRGRLTKIQLRGK